VAGAAHRFLLAEVVSSALIELRRLDVRRGRGLGQCFGSRLRPFATGTPTALTCCREAERF